MAYIRVSQKIFKISSYFIISSTSASVQVMSINVALWRTKFCRQCVNACVWLLLNRFKQSIIFHNKRSPWFLFVFEAGVIFLEISEPV